MTTVPWSEVQVGDLVTAVTDTGKFSHILEASVQHVVPGAFIVTGAIQVTFMDQATGEESLVTTIPLLEAPIYVPGSWRLLMDYSPSPAPEVHS